MCKEMMMDDELKFIREITHELAQPLMILTGHMSMLKIIDEGLENNPNINSIDKGIKRIEEIAQKMQRFVQDQISADG